MKRREFLEVGAKTGVAGTILLLGPVGCGTGADDGIVGCEADIGMNHGHRLVVSEEDLSAGVEKTYNIRGSAVHGHDITLSAADFEALNQGETVSGTVNSFGHPHSYSVSTVNCSQEKDPIDEENESEEGGSCDPAANVEYDFNHNHAFTVSKADIDAGLEKTYMIQGTSDHDHSLRVSAADFSELQEGRSVVLNSGDGDSHSHQITLSCAAA